MFLISENGIKIIQIYLFQLHCFRKLTMLLERSSSLCYSGLFSKRQKLAAILSYTLDVHFCHHCLLGLSKVSDDPISYSKLQFGCISDLNIRISDMDSDIKFLRIGYTLVKKSKCWYLYSISEFLNRIFDPKYKFESDNLNSNQISDQIIEFSDHQIVLLGPSRQCLFFRLHSNVIVRINIY